MKLPALLALPVLALAPAAQATDVSGLWVINTAVGQTPVVTDCSILQLGVALSGWCEPESPGATPIALTGQLDRTQASWAYDTNVQGQPVHVAYQGTLTADTLGMTGQLSYGTSSAGLTAVRK